jgi:hypothetical protein
VINEIRFSARLKFGTEEKSGPPLFSPQDRIAKQHSNVLTVQRWSLGQQRRPQEKKVGGSSRNTQIPPFAEWTI